MSDFLHRLADRARGAAPAIRPRLAGRFEPVTPAAEPFAEVAEVTTTRAPAAPAWDDHPADRAPLPVPASAAVDHPTESVRTAALEAPQVGDPQVAGPQGMGPQETGPQGMGPHETGPQGMGPQETGPQIRPPESRSAETRDRDSRAAEIRLPDSQDAEVQLPDGQGMEVRLPDSRVAEKRMPDRPAPEDSAPVVIADPRVTMAPAVVEEPDEPEVVTVRYPIAISTAPRVVEPGTERVVTRTVRAVEPDLSSARGHRAATAAEPESMGVTRLLRIAERAAAPVPAITPIRPEFPGEVQVARDRVSDGDRPVAVRRPAAAPALPAPEPAPITVSVTIGRVEVRAAAATPAAAARAPEERRGPSALQDYLRRRSRGETP